MFFSHIVIVLTKLGNWTVSNGHYRANSWQTTTHAELLIEFIGYTFFVEQVHRKIIEVMTRVKITGESVKFVGTTSILPQELIKWAYYLNLYKTDLHFITFHFVCYSQFDTLNSKFKSNHANKQITICGWKLCPLKVFKDFSAGFKVYFVCFCRQECYVLKWKCVKWDSVHDFPVQLMLNSSKY